MPPLSASGIEEKKQDLYNLSDDALLEEAQIMCQDFKNWVRTNFELNTAQEEYLDIIPENISFIWGTQFSALLMSKGNLLLQVDHVKEKRTKQISTEFISNIEYEEGQYPQVAANGTLRILYHQ